MAAPGAACGKPNAHSGPLLSRPPGEQCARALGYKAALTGFLADYRDGCGGAVGSGSSVGGALVKTGIAASLNVIPIVGSALSSVFGKVVGIFGAHHAAAVKLEQATLCQAVPDANNFLRQIASLVATGQMGVAAASPPLQPDTSNCRRHVKPLLHA